MRKEYQHFKLKRAHARTLQHTLRGMRTRNAYRVVREKTKLLQSAALVKLARMRAEELKSSPADYSKILRRDAGALDEMVNEETGEKISLSQSVALSLMLKDKGDGQLGQREYATRLREMSAAERNELAQRAGDLASAPEDLIAEASIEQLTSTVLASMLWQRAGAHVRLPTADAPPFTISRDPRGCLFACAGARRGEAAEARRDGVQLPAIRSPRKRAGIAGVGGRGARARRAHRERRAR